MGCIAGWPPPAFGRGVARTPSRYASNARAIILVVAVPLAGDKLSARLLTASCLQDVARPAPSKMGRILSPQAACFMRLGVTVYPFTYIRYLRRGGGTVPPPASLMRTLPCFKQARCRLIPSRLGFGVGVGRGCVDNISGGKMGRSSLMRGCHEVSRASGSWCEVLSKLSMFPLLKTSPKR